MIGGHCIRTWSSTQASVTLSSGEAEYYGLVRAGAHAIGIQSLCKDRGIDCRIRLRNDASSQATPIAIAGDSLAVITLAN